MNPSRTTNNKTLSLFDIVFNIGIGVNVEGLTRVIPSSFSKEVGKKQYILLMKVKPGYKLPSFRLGFMEVVTAIAHAVAASFLVTNITAFKKNSLLNVMSQNIAPGWTDVSDKTFNTASSQFPGTGRMVDEMKHVSKHSHFFFNRVIYTTNLCAAGL